MREFISHEELRIFKLIKVKRIDNYYELERYIDKFESSLGISHEDVLVVVMKYPEQLRLMFDSAKRELDREYELSAIDFCIKEIEDIQKALNEDMVKFLNEQSGE